MSLCGDITLFRNRKQIKQPDRAVSVNTELRQSFLSGKEKNNSYKLFVKMPGVQNATAKLGVCGYQP